MGLLALNRLMSVRRERRRRRRGQIRARNGLVALLSNENGSNCQHSDSPQGGKRMRYSGPDLPEDIWYLIHSLMPLRDAARAACVSHAFLRSWRCRPGIAFSRATLGLNENERGGYKIIREFNSKVDDILKKHSGIGLKTFEIDFCGYNANTSCYLNSWLEIAVTSELEELTLTIPYEAKKYNFPSSLLSNGSGSSIQRLYLSRWAFSTTVGLNCLKNLRSVHLREVNITEDKLECLFLNSTALEHFDLDCCNKITCLKIPRTLQRLSCLRVFECERLQVIEIKAPDLSSFDFTGDQVELLLAQPLQLKNIKLSMPYAICYVCAKLLSLVPNLKSLSIDSSCEVVNTTIAASAFLHLKYLGISLYGAAFTCAYDCFSMVSFLDAAPSLETLDLGVSQIRMQHESIVEHPSPLRQMAGHPHNHLKSLKIIGFCSAKSLVELTCYILENAVSLDCCTLDTTLGLPRCSANKYGKCFSIRKDMLRESERALLAVQTYIEGKVPPPVKFNVLGHCSLCHAMEL